MSTTSPCAGMPASRSARERLSSRRPGRGTARVLVDDVSLAGSVTGAITRTSASPSRRPACAPSSSSSPSASRSRRRGSCAARSAWTTSSSFRRCARRRSAPRACAPGTPYSYGLPTTCGISSKLKIGGGELTCHSSVSARHGFAGGDRPACPAADHVVEEDDRRGAEQERDDRDEQVPVAELGRVVGDAARHPLQPDPVHREEGAR